MKWWQFAVVALNLAATLWLLGMVRELQPGTGGGGDGGGGGGGGGGGPEEPMYFTGDCFHVVPDPPPGAHAQKDDRYCIQEKAGFWQLIPGAGMEDWHSVAGPKEIPLDVKANAPGVFVAFFDVAVDGHPVSDHGPNHQAPDFGFMVQVNVAGPDTEAIVRPVGRPGGPVHGGTAHAEL